VVDGFQLLEAMDVFRADSALPDSSSGGRQQLLVVRLADELVQRIQTAIFADEVARFLLFGALNSGQTSLTSTVSNLQGA